MDRIGKALVVRDVDGSLQPPGAGPGVRICEPDGSEVTAIARGDSFDLYFGRKTVYNHSITPRAAMRLARFLVWWWVRHAWFGLKLVLWRWVLVSILERRWKEDA
jgi:hypothetical protein